MTRHRIDGRERRIRGTFRYRGVIGIGKIRIRRARWCWWILAQLLPDDHQIFVLLQNIPGNVVRIVVHVLGTVGGYFGPIGMIQGTPVVQT